MNDRNLLRTGIIGSAIAAICCLAPALVLLLGAVGPPAWLAGLDYVLLSVLALLLGLPAWTLIRGHRRKGSC